jgi:hypothetical protein
LLNELSLLEKFIGSDVDSFLGFSGHLKSLNDLVLSLGIYGNREGENEAVGDAVGVSVAQNALADPLAVGSMMPIFNVIGHSVST